MIKRTPSWLTLFAVSMFIFAVAALTLCGMPFFHAVEAVMSVTMLRGGITIVGYYIGPFLHPF